MTNFEKYKAMTVDELAGVIMCPYDGEQFDDCEGKNCNKCCKDFLESEVEE